MTAVSNRGGWGVHLEISRQRVDVMVLTLTVAWRDARLMPY